MATPNKLPQLIAGPYQPPLCRVGGELACLDAGDRIVRGITNAAVPWPYSIARSSMRRQLSGQPWPRSASAAARGRGPDTRTITG